MNDAGAFRVADEVSGKDLANRTVDGFVFETCEVLAFDSLLWFSIFAEEFTGEFGGDDHFFTVDIIYTVVEVFTDSEGAVGHQSPGSSGPSKHVGRLRVRNTSLSGRVHNPCRHRGCGATPRLARLRTPFDGSISELAIYQLEFDVGTGVGDGLIGVVVHGDFSF